MNTTNYVKRLGAPAGYIRKPEAAKRLGVICRTLDNWMKRGWIKFHKVGRSVYFKESELLEAFGERSSTAEPAAYNRQVAGSIPAAPTKCDHSKVVDLPDSAFKWCRLCGAVKRIGNDPTVRWVLTGWPPVPEQD